MLPSCSGILVGAISITRSKISYSLIEPQLLLCIPACGYEFHAPVAYPHPTFTVPPVRSAFGIRSEVCGGAYWRKQSTVWLLAVFAEELHRSCLTEFWMWLCLKRRFLLLGLHRGILNSSCVLILLIHTKHKYKKVKSWIDPTSSFPWRRTHPLGRRQKTCE